MLMVIDVGNTNTVIGVYDGRALRASWRVETSARRTSDEYGILLMQLFTHGGLDPKEVGAVAVSSVVPTLQFNLERMCERYFHARPMFVGPGVKTGMPITTTTPARSGPTEWSTPLPPSRSTAGRSSSWTSVRPPRSTPSARRGEYWGGAIAPGISTSMEALFRSASKLPRVEFTTTARHR